MSLLPFTRRPAFGSSVVPYAGASDWDMMAQDPFGTLATTDPLGIQQQLYNDPLVRHTMRNAQLATRDMEPIMYADILDFGDKYEVSADLPGVAKEDLDISFDNNMITIKGERKREWKEDDIFGNRRSERTYGKVTRTMTLPFDCDTEKAVANFDFGVLKVELPKKDVALTGKKLLIK